MDDRGLLHLMIFSTLACLSACQNICLDNNWASGTFPHPDTCSLFVVCNGFSTSILPCPTGESYDPIRGRCVDTNIAAPCNDVKTTVASAVTSGPECKNTSRGDILFIMDASSSIGIHNFTTQLQFVAGLTKPFNLGPDNVQFGAIVFSSTVHNVFALNKFHDHLSLEHAILNTTYMAAYTNTYAALEYARTIAFDSSNGARQGVPHIAIVLTDGESSSFDLTSQEANLLKSSGVHVLAIGIADANRDELLAIASSQLDVFQADSFAVLHSLEAEVTIRTCNEVITTTCKNVTIADVILVMDSSSSIGYSNYQKQLQFAANLTQNFRIGLNDVRFAALIFGTEVQKLFDLGTHSDHNQLYRAIAGATYLSTSTNTGAALSSITSQGMFSVAAGGRDTATKIIITMTDGASTNPEETRLQAYRLKERGIHMISIGVGSAVNYAELATLASDVSNIFTAASYEVLHRLEEEVANRTCDIPSEVSLGDLWNVCREQNWVNGIHAHPFNCSKFIECTFLHTAILSCPADLVFDPIKLTCTFRNEAPSCLNYNDFNPVTVYTTSLPQASTTHADLSYVCRQNNWNSGTYPHPYDCAYYLVCTNYLTNVKACPAGQVYDPISSKCTSPQLAAPCNDVKTTTTIYTTSHIATTTSPHYDLINVCRQYNLPDGIYPDPGSCVHFVECVATLTYHLECPNGLQFNSKVLICDDVHHIDCNDNYNFAFEHILVG